MLALSLIVNTGTFNNAKLAIFYDIKKRRVVRALVLASVKSGKSVDNKNRGALRVIDDSVFYLLIFLIFGYAILGSFLTTDFTDFTDFATHG